MNTANRLKHAWVGAGVWIIAPSVDRTSMVAVSPT